MPRPQGFSTQITFLGILPRVSNVLVTITNLLRMICWSGPLKTEWSNHCKTEQPVWSPVLCTPTGAGGSSPPCWASSGLHCHQEDERHSPIIRSSLRSKALTILRYLTRNIPSTISQHSTYLKPVLTVPCSPNPRELTTPLLGLERPARKFLAKLYIGLIMSGNGSNGFSSLNL